MPSSFDVVVEVYARETHESAQEDVVTHAGDLVRERLESQSAARAASPLDVHEFVRKTVTYLQCLYPNRAGASQDRLILSHLFWGHVVEARLARESSRSPFWYRSLVPRDQEGQTRPVSPIRLGQVLRLPLTAQAGA